MIRLTAKHFQAASLLVSLCVLPLAAQNAQAGEKLSTEQRLERIERQLKSQNLADVIFQMQQLQREVQQLRGEIELQKHTIDDMSKRQRDLYLDIDQRLSGIQPGAAAGAAAPALAPDMTGQDVGMPPAAQSAPTDLSAPAAVLASTAPAATVAPPANVTPPDPKQEAIAYQNAFNLLQQGRYPESIAGFRDFLQLYPGGQYEDNAQYWLGEASYVSRDFDTAMVEFNTLIERYPTSSKVPGALLKSGYIAYEKQDWEKAREMFNRVKEEYPTGSEARLASKRLERMEKEGH